MNEIFNSKIDDLYGRINYRLNSAILASDDEFVNAYDLACITYMSMKKYNAILVDYAKKDADSVNRRTFFKNIFTNRYPYIAGYYPTVTEDGKIFIKVMFANDEGRYKGSAIIDENANVTIDGLSSDYEKKDALSVLSKSLTTYAILIASLNAFKNDYPGHGYTWSNDSTCDSGLQVIDDGFTHVTINLSKPERAIAGLSSMEDIEVARSHSPIHGKLYDYIDLYSESFMKRMGIKIEDLNPLYKDILKKNYALKQGESRKLE